MTIKDIARLANVSPSTVSKIVNGKDHNVSAETRERVLRVVKEYNYAPYANALAQNSGKSLLIGILLRSGSGPMLNGILQAAREEGYGTLVCVSGTPEEELKNISLLLSNRVDGVLWEAPWDAAQESHLAQRGIPVFYVDGEKIPKKRRNFSLDYFQLGYFAAEELASRKHQRIVCLAEGESPAVRAFREGFAECLYQHNIHGTVPQEPGWEKEDLLLDQMLLTATGFVCFDLRTAARVSRRAMRKNYVIPRDLSIVSLAEEKERSQYDPALSMIRLPLSEFGRYCCHRLVARLEKRGGEEAFRPAYTLESESSVDVPITFRNKKIVVVGALNMDTLVNMSCFPRMGETTTAKSLAVLPGGKGANQAIGAAKLGAEVCLVGRLGRDYQGSALLEALHTHQIDVSGVKMDPRAGTGHAYIYVQENGESSIVIFEGANRNLSPEDILEEEDAFKNAGYCLLQTEIRGETVECAAKLAKQKGARVILKPAAISEISDNLLRHVDIFLPNHNEFNRIYPGSGSLEEKAQHFLDRGVDTVIVTLAHKGCYLRNKEHSRYFPAADFQPVDTTGAADAFAATLAVYLSEGRDIVAAIRYATYAAGFSITRQGVPPALADKSTLELYLSDKGLTHQDELDKKEEGYGEWQSTMQS